MNTNYMIGATFYAYFLMITAFYAHFGAYFSCFWHLSAWAGGFSEKRLDEKLDFYEKSKISIK